MHPTPSYFIPEYLPKNKLSQAKYLKKKLYDKKVWMF